MATPSITSPSHDRPSRCRPPRPSSHLEFDVLMESKGGKKSSSSRSMMYEAPLGYSIEDVRPAGGVKKFQSAAYSNCAKKPS
ncbi:hypothetical protein BAE44_0021981 [Dichanthelium oligosanthes]|uniref:S-adenosylmethionine decarboxylase proenzyme n=1 Tax=Dichanthelium oligosanthes TaxID=888268 RepID=A0A1E5UVT4_9POAL|nr:hypothetical protein BAE44_0021981 [Dichanthelium oligosanthes]